MKEANVVSAANPFVFLGATFLAKIDEAVPVVFSQGLAWLARSLQPRFGQRQFLLASGMDLVPFAAGLSLSLRSKEKEKRDLNIRLKDDHKVLVFAEAGETLSYPGILSSERKYPQADLLYVCFDSQFYSVRSAEPRTWWQLLPLDLFSYAAQLSYSHFDDFIQKVDKALNLKGFRYLHLLSPSPLYWRFLNGETLALMKAEVETGFWPLFEKEGNAGKINLEVKKIKEKYLQDLWKDLRNKLKTAAA